VLDNDIKSVEEIERMLKDAGAELIESNLSAVKRLGIDEIIAYFDNRTTSGVVEGINNKLKLIKRSAYGFRNFDNFRLRCLLGDLTIS
jgi:transposase